MKASAEVIMLQRKQEAKFICSACGADRICNCNAPALERLTQLEEKAAEQREKKRKQKQKQREKSNENNDPVAATYDAEASSAARKQTYADEECADCDTPEDFWYRGIRSRAGDAIAGASLSHLIGHGDWTKFRVTSELVTLAKQAAEAWNELADVLEAELDK